jgi:ABC-2 type transport system permease protein
MSAEVANKSAAKPARRGGRQRRVLSQVATSASSLLMMAVVLMVNYLAFRHYKRLDWTSVGMFTLSPKSVKVLDDLNKDIDLYLFMSQGEPNFQNTDELIKRYSAQSRHLKAHYVDPEREPSEFKLLAQRFGILEGTTGAGEVRADVAAVVVLGDKNWHINREDLVGWDPAGGADPNEPHEQLNVKAEQALTGAVVQVTSGRATKVCVTKGHGEWSLEEGDERSLSALKNGLRHDNIEWEAIDTLGQKELPKTCDAVFVLGPERAFSEAEAKLVIDYVQAGGNAWLALDPVIERDELLPTGFEAPLKALGVRLDRSLAVELSPKHLLSPSPLEFAVDGFGDHATTRALKGQAHVVMALARSLSVEQPTPSVEVLLRTSAEAFGATDITRITGEGQEPAKGPGDISGPLDLALAVNTRPLPAGDAGPDASAEKPGGRLLVVGDSDLLQPALLESPDLANFHLASAWTGWLTQREALIEIPPKKVKGGSIMFTQDGLSSSAPGYRRMVPAASLRPACGVCAPASSSPFWRLCCSASSFGSSAEV